MSKRISFSFNVLKFYFKKLPVKTRVILYDIFNQCTVRFISYEFNYLRYKARYRKNTQDDLVSVIMPSWNRRSVIKKSIDSVLKQSYKKFELIISDDGSTDGTIDFIKENYSDLIISGKIKLLQNEHHGVSYARNSGLYQAKGQVIAYLDSDNTWRDDYLLIMVNSLLCSPTKTTAYSGLYIKNYQEGRAEILMEDKFNFAKLSNDNFIDINGFIHYADMIKKFGFFDDKLTRLVDWDLILRYTKEQSPLIVPIIAVNYFLAENLNNITLGENFDDNYFKVRNKH